MRNNPPIPGLRMLRHPLFITAVGLLLVNDHYLKTHFPSFVTGKLSDVAGLFVAAVWAAALLGSSFRSARALQGLLAGIAGMFSLLQLEAVLAGIAAACDWLNLPRPNLVADPTDLAALAVLPLAYDFIRRQTAPEMLTASPASPRRLPAYLMLLIAAAAMIATSFVSRYQVQTPVTLAGGGRLAETLFLMEQAWLEGQIEIVERRQLSEQQFRYRIEFTLAISDTVPGAHFAASPASGEILVSLPAGQDRIVLEKVEVNVYNRKLDPDLVETLLRERLIDPVLRKLGGG